MRYAEEGCHEWRRCEPMREFRLCIHLTTTAFLSRTWISVCMYNRYLRPWRDRGNRLESSSWNNDDVSLCDINDSNLARSDIGGWLWMQHPIWAGCRLPTCIACLLESFLFFFSIPFLFYTIGDWRNVFTRKCVGEFHIYLARDVDGYWLELCWCRFPKPTRRISSRNWKNWLFHVRGARQVWLRKGGRSFRTMSEMLICISAWMRSPDYEALFADRLRGWNPDRFSARLED